MVNVIKQALIGYMFHQETNPAPGWGGESDASFRCNIEVFWLLRQGLPEAAYEHFRNWTNPVICSTDDSHI